MGGLAMIGLWPIGGVIGRNGGLGVFGRMSHIRL